MIERGFARSLGDSQPRVEESKNDVRPDARQRHAGAPGDPIIMMIGNPGSGKTSLARATPGNLPEMAVDEALPYRPKLTMG